MRDQIAFFGGSFNPPGLHHRAIAERLGREFDRVIVMPCGPRDDKLATNWLPAIHRAVMADMTFGDLPRVTVDLSDLEQERYTRTFDLDERLRREGDVWHVVGVDLITGGAQGQSEIQRSWFQGQRLWTETKFVVITRPGYEFSNADLPPHHRLIELHAPGASREIRDMLAKGESITDRVTARTLDYLQRYGLYRAPIPSSWARGSLSGLRYRLLADPRNPKATDWAHQLAAQDQATDPSEFLTILGGDGSMLRCIREHWRERLPFYGINAGNLGFLMNQADGVLGAPFPPNDVIFRQMPMLYLEVEDATGHSHTAYAFNDAWVERDSSQSAWLQVRVNGVERLTKLVSDGALVATAAGSTAYARSMGASPLLADTPAWLLVGSNVMEPADWKSALLSTDSVVEICSLDPVKRPIRAYADGTDLGIVHRLKARISKAAAAELVFNADHDMAEKIAAIQFR
jgi:NAD+ kinase